MADQQPRLLAPPARYNNAQQPQQRPEELAVQLDLPPLLVLAFVRTLLVSGCRRCRAGRRGASLRVPRRRGLLLRDGVSHAVDEGQEQREVHGARDPLPVGQVRLRQLQDYAPDRVLAERGGYELRVGWRHDGGEVGAAEATGRDGEVVARMDGAGPSLEADGSVRGSPRGWVRRR